MGAGPRVRSWLKALAGNASLVPGLFVTDSASHSHLQRNARTLPTALLRAPRAVDGQRGYGHVVNMDRLGHACLAPYGGNNGWEGRAAEALRRGCVPFDVKPRGSGRPLAPFVPYERFALFLDDGSLGAPPGAPGRGRRDPGGEGGGAPPPGVVRLRAALGGLSVPRLNAMRCEMACAATSMSYLPAHPLDAPAAALARAPPYVPPATCAVDAVTNATGLAASLIELLERRKRVPEGSAPPRCRCHAKPRHWHSTYSHSSA